MEEKKAKAKADESKARDMYNKVIAAKKKFINESLPKMKETKPKYCKAMPKRQGIPG
jgi:hypothetical protein